MKVSTTSPLRWLSAYLPPLLWAIVIYLLSAQSVLPSFEQSAPDFILKKIGHMTVYAVLYFLLYRALKQTVSYKSPVYYVVIPFLICFVYAVTDELHQGTVPGRYPTARDIGYDMIGASVALLKTTNCI